MALLTGSNITEFHFIHSGNDSNGKKDTNPEYKFAISLSSSLAKHNISYHDYEVAEGAITVPYIEDSDDKFILRQSYDNTAIIDSSYAADNFEFFDLMNGSNYSPKLYMSSSIDDIDIDTHHNFNSFIGTLIGIGELRRLKNKRVLMYNNFCIASFYENGKCYLNYNAYIEILKKVKTLGDITFMD